jgi:hypothetical protein
MRVRSSGLRIADACELIGLHRGQVFRLLRGLKRDGATRLSPSKLTMWDMQVPMAGTLRAGDSYAEEMRGRIKETRRRRGSMEIRPGIPSLDDRCAIEFAACLLFQRSCGAFFIRSWSLTAPSTG